MAKSMLKAIILGCGSSGGVPRIGNDWGACDPSNPRNRRRRCSLYVEQSNAQGSTRVLIDTGPDLREQLLSANIDQLDAVLYTHDHADHIHGIDDLRVLAIRSKQRVPVYADPRTAAVLKNRFGYTFEPPKNSPYPAILDMHPIDSTISVTGAGGILHVQPFQVEHGGITALGFRFGPLGYTPDISMMSDEAWQVLAGVDTWIIDALRYAPHPTHTHLDRTLEWIERLKPKRAIITNMHIDLDYSTLKNETTDNVDVAYDGMQLEFTL